MPVLSDPLTLKKLERVQRQSARFIIGDFSFFSSVTSMLTDLNIPSLVDRRQLSSIILLYKVIHNLIDISSIDLLPVTRGHNQRFHHLFARTIPYSNSLFPRYIYQNMARNMELTSTPLNPATIFNCI